MRFASAVVGLALVALLAVAAAPSYAGEGDAGVKWTDSSWETVLTQAKEQNKYVFVDFYTTWCGPCKRLDKITYQDAKVIDFLNSTVPVKLDAEKEGEELAHEYRVAFYPTLIVIGPDGEEVDRHLGYLDPEQFLNVIEGYTKGIGTVAALEQKLGDNPDDIEILHDLGLKYSDAVHPDKATEALGRVLDMDPEDTRGWRSEILYSLANVNYTSNRLPESKKYFEKVINEYPDSDWYKESVTLLARVEYKMGNNDAAVAAYQKYVDRHADDPGVLNGFAWFCAQRKIGLDKALPVALKAADLSGRDPGILDTLAEVYFAMHDYDNAIKIGKEALAKEPDDTYLQGQVKKFQAAKDEADSQAHS